MKITRLIFIVLIAQATQSACINLTLAENKQWFGAARTGDTSTITKLLSEVIDLQDDNGLTALMMAAANDQVETVKALLSAGANVNLQTTPQGYSALMLAISRNYTATISALLAVKNIDLNLKNSKGWDALRWAIFLGHKDSVRALLDAGADVEIEDEDGLTALNFATIYNRPEIVALLLQHGAQPK